MQMSFTPVFPRGLMGMSPALGLAGLALAVPASPEKTAPKNARLCMAKIPFWITASFRRIGGQYNARSDWDKWIAVPATELTIESGGGIPNSSLYPPPGK
jgi:hypothetical protein